MAGRWRSEATGHRSGHQAGSTTAGDQAFVPRAPRASQISTAFQYVYCVLPTFEFNQSTRTFDFDFDHQQSKTILGKSVSLKEIKKKCVDSLDILS